jgi:uncharacterized protein with HEPN domain
MPSERRDKARVEHIRSAIASIRKYVDGMNETMFLAADVERIATIKHLEIIGEAAKHLSEDYKGHLAEVPWRDIVDMRNVMVHEYFGIDSRIVWHIVENELLDLERAIKFNLDS